MPFDFVDMILLMSNIISTKSNGIGLITLQRPEAINALSLDMVLNLTTTLMEWRADTDVKAVAIRGSSKEGEFGNFCAGGDIRFFYNAAISGNRCIIEKSNIASSTKITKLTFF